MEMKTPKGVCEKIFRAITLGPAFTTIHRISSPRQQSTAKHAHTPSLPNSVFTTKPTSKPTTTEESSIPIKFDYTPTQEPKPKATLSSMAQPSTHRVISIVPGNAQHAQDKFKPSRSVQVQIKRHQTKEEAKKTTRNYDSFDEFIKQTKKRIMSDDDTEDQDLDKVRSGGIW